MRPLFVTTLLLAFACSAYAQKKKEGDNLKPYFFVILKKAPNRSHDSVHAEKLHKGHIDNINRLAAAGKLNVAGPFLDDGDMRGIFVFDCGSEDSGRTIGERHRAIEAGRPT